MKSRFRFWIAASVLPLALLIFALTVLSKKEAKRSVLLFGGIKSGISVLEAEKILRKRYGNLKVVDDSNLITTSGSYSVKTITIENFREGETVGSAELFFFNDQLMKGRVYPQKFEDFVESLRIARSINVQSVDKYESGNLVVQKRSFLNGPPYVEFVDEEIGSEYDQFMRDVP